MRRVILTGMVAFLAGCGQGGEGDSPPLASPAPTVPEMTAADRAAALSALPSPYAQADLDNGRRAFARCRSCHTITPGGPNMTGPNLHGMFGRTAGAQPGYNYSRPLREAAFVWDLARLDDWLQNPRTFLPGNKMAFPGMPDETDRRDLIAFLQIETAPR